MNPGVTQGFIRFDSLACHILRQLHAHGTMTGPELARCGTRSEAVQVSATLQRLRKAGHVYVVGRHRPTGTRSCWLYDLAPRAKPTGPRVMTDAERQKTYRDRRKVKVPSVFAFRGSISL